jgi:hypothetical protein
VGFEIKLQLKAMLFSGKITNSFLVFLDRAGIDTERLFDVAALPTEFLRDPSCWIAATDVEQFLSTVDKEFSSSFNESLPSLVGHQCNELRAWGVLDSVIRMMSQPQDLFLQPQRFISYFVSPAPPIAQLVRQAESVSFDIPISDLEFPMTTEFLRAAMEVLPRYLGHQSAIANWSGNRLTISWAQSQGKFLDDADLTPNFKPELVQSLMQALEESQAQVEDLKAQLGQRTGGEPAIATEMDPEFQAHLRAYVVKVRGHLMKLADYLVRSQQLVTLLVGQDRMNRQVQEAMRRVDWEYIKLQSSPVAQEIVDLLSDFEREVTAKARPKMDRTPSLKLQRTLDLQG